MVTNPTEWKTSTEASLVETGEKRDRLGRRITPKARRAELVAAWRESGLTQAEFARREGIIYSSFAAWVQATRLVPAKTLPAKPRPAPVRFVEAGIPSATAPAAAFAVCVRLPDGTELRGRSGRELAAVLRVLRP